ncbi:cell division ATP-binding protein FtsE [Haliangium sp.]|uniref:cell division ATP-binding protein FtsE n=1 Tax=Haliangium sp. TaxID=2663208 RepID=UPI003D0B14E2
MIELRGVSKRHRGRTQGAVFEDVELCVHGGEVVLISGPTGAGKSTLLKLLYAAELAERGRVSVFDRDLARLRRSSIALLRRHIGVVPQSFSLLSDLSALRNVALALEVRAEPQRDMLMRAAEALSAVGLAAEADTPVSRMSVGERQRVAIARALVGEPAVLLADEATAHLDGLGREMFIDVLIDVQSRGGAAVVVTTDHMLLSAGARCSWRHLELADGTLRVIADRRPELIDGSAATGADDRDELPATAAPTKVDDDRDDAVGEWEDGVDTNVVPFPVVARVGELAT